MKIAQKQVEDMILGIAGSDGLLVYKALKNKENVNEFLIADSLKLTINQVRNIIYKFDAFNLVMSIRKKDRKKGWYIYFWTFIPERAVQVFILLKKKRIEHLKLRLEREMIHQFYLCMYKCTRTPLEVAMENQFMCVECGQLMLPDDNKKTINVILKEIHELKEEVRKSEALQKPKKVIQEKPQTKNVSKKPFPLKKGIQLVVVTPKRIRRKQ